MIMEISIDELKTERQIKITYGRLEALAFIALLIIISFTKIYEPVRNFLLICIFLLGIGIIYHFLVTFNLNVLIKSYEIFKTINPEYLILTREFVLAKKDEIYMITPRGCNGIWFIKFKNEIKKIKTLIGTIKLPRTPAWKWSYKRINEIKIAEKEEEVIIPDENFQYIEGNAKAYFVEVLRILIPPAGIVDESEKIKRNLKEILNYVKGEN